MYPQKRKKVIFRSWVRQRTHGAESVKEDTITFTNNQAGAQG